MSKYIIINLLFSTLFSQIIENEFLNRARYDVALRLESTTQINNNRDEEELLEFIESTMEDYLIPGISISIVKDQNIVWEKHFGYSDIIKIF